MANTFTTPTWIKAEPHASAEFQVGDVDPGGATDVINRPPKGLWALVQRIVNTVLDNATLDGTDQATTTAFPAAALILTPRGYLAGLGCSNDGVSPNTVIDVAAGVCTADDATVTMVLAAFTKSTAAWAVGSGNGGLDTGAIAANTWYYVYVIKRTDTGVVDVLFSLSATAPTLPANYTKKRLIYMFKTAAATTNILPFTQDGDVSWWNDPATNGLDFNVNAPGNAAATRTAFVPRIAGVLAILNVSIVDTTNSNGVLYISPLTATDSAPSNTAAPLGVASETAQMGGMGQVQVRVDGSAQFRTRVSGTAGATTTIYGQTVGWVFRRGRDT